MSERAMGLQAPRMAFCGGEKYFLLPLEPSRSKSQISQIPITARRARGGSGRPVFPRVFAAASASRIRRKNIFRVLLRCTMTL